MAVGTSSLVTATLPQFSAKAPAQDAEITQDEEDCNSVLEEADNDGKKKKKKKNKKKKKQVGGDSISEVSMNDQSLMDESMNQSRSGSTNTRPGAMNRKSTGQDFTPLKEKIDDTFFDDQDSSEDEGMPDYKIGGYHPVHVGEILLDRYIIIQKLGWGHFSTVWLTKDLKYNSYVAIKVQKSAQHYLEAAYDEVEILDQVAKNWRC